MNFSYSFFIFPKSTSCMTTLCSGVRLFKPVSNVEAQDIPGMCPPCWRAETHEKPGIKPADQEVGREYNERSRKCLFKWKWFAEAQNSLFSHTLEELPPQQTQEQWALGDQESPQLLSAGCPWTHSALSLTPELCVFCCQGFGACLQVLCLLSLVTWWLFCTSFCSFTISPGSLFLLTKPLLLGCCSLPWAQKNMERPPTDACHPPPAQEKCPFKTRISKIYDNNNKICSNVSWKCPVVVTF